MYSTIRSRHSVGGSTWFGTRLLNVQSAFHRFPHSELSEMGEYASERRHCIGTELGSFAAWIYFIFACYLSYQSRHVTENSVM